MKPFRLTIFLPVVPEYRRFLAFRELIANAASWLFGGCTIVDDLEGRYRSRQQEIVKDTMSIIFTDTFPMTAKQKNQLKSIVRRIADRMA
jgi:hypothetical protein